VKVYGITGMRAGRQTREIGAFPNLPAFLAASGHTMAYWRWSGSVTGNAAEIAAATAAPGVVLSRGLDDRTGPWERLS
jgi:hypothetical protein